MARPPVVNIASRPEGSAEEPRKPGLSFNADLPPEDPDAAAELAAGAHYGQPASVPAPTARPTPTPAPALEKPRFTLTGGDIAAIVQIEYDYRRGTGDEVTSSRVVRAAVRAFRELDPEERARRIAAVEEHRPGPKRRSATTD